MAVAEHIVIKNIMQDLEKRKQPLHELINNLHFLQEEIADLRSKAAHCPQARQRIAKLEGATGSDVGELAQRINENIERLQASFKAFRESFKPGGGNGSATPVPSRKKAVPARVRKFI